MVLAVEALTHRYGTETAVEGVSLDVPEGELVALLGPSGCGKTTVVQAVAGHVRPTAGTVRLRGTDVTTAPPETRQVGVVFQRSTLFPHMTVGENVAYGLEARGVGRDERDELVAEYLELVALAGRRDAAPGELSGGERRRVELARALAPEPDVLLLDEPLSALDRGLRRQLRDEIARIQRETAVTTLFVTHDQEDAMALADRLVVMNDGAVAGRGDPRRLYESPPTPFVASFLGRSNTFEAAVAGTDPLVLAVGEQELTLPTTDGDRPPGTPVACHVRPEHLTVRPRDSSGGTATLHGAVTRVADRGRRYDVTVGLPTGDELVVEHRGDPPAVGDGVSVEVEGAKLTLFGVDARPPGAP
jgi:ABC-type Fe3+/spermidine/putrescine transport system ATPase subunit